MIGKIVITIEGDASGDCHTEIETDIKDADRITMWTLVCNLCKALHLEEDDLWMLIPTWRAIEQTEHETIIIDKGAIKKGLE